MLLTRTTAEKEIPPITAVPIQLRFAHYFILAVALITVLLWLLQGQLEGLTGNIGITALIPVVCYFGSGYLTYVSRSTTVPQGRF